MTKNFGISKEHWDWIEKLAIQPLKSAGARVWVFGSRALGTYKTFSDLDILYEIAPNTQLPAGLLSEIKEKLEESHLPIKVDLVDLSNLASSYRSEVLSQRQEV